MTAPRARAGQPYTYPSECGSSGCNGPWEGDCLGFCTLHRVEPSQVERVNAMPITKEPPFEMHEPTAWQRIRMFFTKEWK